MEILRESSVKIGMIQRRLAWPLRKDDTLTSRRYQLFERQTRDFVAQAVIEMGEPRPSHICGRSQRGAHGARCSARSADSL